MKKGIEWLNDGNDVVEKFTVVITKYIEGGNIEYAAYSDKYKMSAYGIGKSKEDALCVLAQDMQALEEVLVELK